MSLDSYEEMNEVPGLAEQRESWLNAQYQPPGEVLPPQPLPHGEKYPDPTNRAKVCSYHLNIKYQNQLQGPEESVLILRSGGIATIEATEGKCFSHFVYY